MLFDADAALAEIRAEELTAKLSARGCDTTHIIILDAVRAKRRCEAIPADPRPSLSRPQPDPFDFDAALAEIIAAPPATDNGGVA